MFKQFLHKNIISPIIDKIAASEVTQLNDILILSHEALILKYCKDKLRDIRLSEDYNICNDLQQMYEERIELANINMRDIWQRRANGLQIASKLKSLGYL